MILLEELVLQFLFILYRVISVHSTEIFMNTDYQLIIILTTIACSVQHWVQLQK